MHYLYSLNKDQPQQATTIGPDGGTMGGPVTLDVPVSSFGPQDLRVWAVDRAGNQSPAAEYKFGVAGGYTDPADFWNFDATGDGGTTAHDVPGGHDLTLNASGLFGSGHSGQGLVLNGTAAQTGQTSGPVVDTSQDFTVSAWVNLANTTGFATAVSQDDASGDGGFFLQYSQPDNQWAFSTPGGRALSGDAPQLNTWVNLTGVYDASAKTITLYENGVARGSVNVPAGPASGPLGIGRAQWNGSPTDFFPGGIDGVRVYKGALTSDQVFQVARLP